VNKFNCKHEKIEYTLADRRPLAAFLVTSKNNKPNELFTSIVINKTCKDCGVFESEVINFDQESLEYMFLKKKHKGLCNE
jgi:hypothetical protein